jgi:hypothetical protein
MSNWISSGMGTGTGTGGIPTTDNIPETTEIFGFPTENIPDNISHNNVIFVIKSKSKILKNSLKSAYNLAYLSYILIDTLL